MKKNVFTIMLFVVLSIPAVSQVFIEAESFTNKGGWVVDQQFINQMGSSFLMAHGLGKPVDDASTEVTFAADGKYNVFVRTRNWTGYWSDKEAAGKFQLSVNSALLPGVFGTKSTEWTWEPGGTIEIKKGKNTIALHDITGFNGRCDAILFTTDNNYKPVNDLIGLAGFRKKMPGLPSVPENAGKSDLVVIGGGMAGTCAAISAARLGMKVALIQDRPVLGGNNSSEVRVHLGGRINLQPYPALGNLVNEIGPSKGGNAQDASYYEDRKKMDAVVNEKNISLFLNYRAVDVKKSGNLISSVTAIHSETSKELVFTAPLFADCTGDGTIGALAGADFLMGRESRSEYNEPTAPEKADKMTMGASVQWYSEELASASPFPEIGWALPFNEKSSQLVKMGEWTWETGMQYDQIKDFEKIRDYGLLVVFSNWADGNRCSGSCLPRRS